MTERGSVSVSSSTSRIVYAGNNSLVTAYAVPFYFEENAHLNAIAKTAAGVETVVTLTNHTGAGNENGGTVRTAVAVPATSTLAIYREVPATQLTSYADNDAFPAASHERALDKLTTITQQLERRITNCIRGTEATPLSPIPSPTGTQQFVLSAASNQPPSWQELPALAAGPVVATGSTQARFISDRFADVVNVKDFGAVGDGVADDTAGVTTALLNGNAYFRDGIFNILGNPTFTGPKTFGLDSSATVTGAGAATLGFYLDGLAKEQLLQHNTSGGDTATKYIRRIANHTGGTPGWVSCAFSAKTDVTNSSATNFEWAILGVVDNSAAAGENVGGYFQGIKRSTGPTWGATVEVIDKTGPNPTTGAVALEVDITANGTDNNNSRVGIDIAVRKDNILGSGCVAAFGIRFQTQAGSSVVVGLDTTICSITQAAIKMAQGQAIAFDANATDKIASDGTGIAYYSGGVLQSKLVNDGGIFLTGRTKIAGTFLTGSQTPSLGTNKPGSTSSGPLTWLSVLIDGIQHWVPAWGN